MAWLPLYFRLLKELLRYDILDQLVGFRGVQGGLEPQVSQQGANSSGMEAAVCEALRNAAPFYWKPVACLQRSVVTARVLRAYGTPADLMMGYRLAPFMAHAWVEVGGRIINDSSAFQRLQTLEWF